MDEWVTKRKYIINDKMKKNKKNTQLLQESEQKRYRIVIINYKTE